MARPHQCTAYFAFPRTGSLLQPQTVGRCDERAGHETDQPLHRTTAVAGPVTVHYSWRLPLYDYVALPRRRAPHIPWPFGDPLYEAPLYEAPLP